MVYANLHADETLQSIKDDCAVCYSALQVHVVKHAAGNSGMFCEVSATCMTVAGCSNGPQHRHCPPLQTRRQDQLRILKKPWQLPNPRRKLGACSHRRVVFRHTKQKY